MNTINKYIKHLSLFFIVVGLVVSSGALQVSQVTAQTPTAVPEHDSLWDRLRVNFHLDHAIEQELVQTHRSWYLNNPEYIENVFDRAEPYLYYIAEEIEARDLPLEVLLIPVVESTYDPHAKSHRGAMGLWQLMTATARYYNVVQNGAYDGRRDIRVSTHVALEHLRYLADLYDNDWHLVLAAYNAGQGTVNRAIRKNELAGLSTDFWALSSLPKETRHYVPKIMALADVVKNYQRHNIDLPPVADVPQVAAVDINVEDYLDLTIAANLAEVEPETLREMNPGFTQAVIANHAESIMIPADKVEIFQAALENYTPAKKSASAATSGSTATYVVKSGDTLNQLSKTHGVSVAMLQQYNNLSDAHLDVGQVLKIPRGTA